MLGKNPYELSECRKAFSYATQNTKPQRLYWRDPVNEMYVGRPWVGRHMLVNIRQCILKRSPFSHAPSLIKHWRIHTGKKTCECCFLSHAESRFKKKDKNRRGIIWGGQVGERRKTIVRNWG
jgi:hypothetical protein